MAGLVKAASAMPMGQVLFARSIILVPIVLVILASQKRLGDLKTAHPGKHLARALLGFAGLAFWFMALRFLPLTEVTALLYLGPVLNVLFAGFLLKETIGWAQAGAVAVGLIGMAVIMVPQLDGDYDQFALIGAGLCLLNAVTFSLSLVQIRQMTFTEKTITIVFYYSLFSSLFSLMTLPFGWVVPSQEHLLILLGIGALGGFGQYLMTAAYRRASLSILAPFEYLTLLWATLIALVFFGEFPPPTTILGGLIVAAAGLTVVYRVSRPKTPEPIEEMRA